MRHVIVRLNADGKSGIVENAIEIDYDQIVTASGANLGDNAWFPPEGCISIPAGPDENGDTPCTGWQYDGTKFSAPVPQPAPVPTFTPLAIVRALRAFDPDKAKALLAGIDDLDRAEFYAATTIRADEPRLVAGLAQIGLTPADLLKFMGG